MIVCYSMVDTLSRHIAANLAVDSIVQDDLFIKNVRLSQSFHPLPKLLLCPCSDNRKSSAHVQKNLAWNSLSKNTVFSKKYVKSRV